MTSIQPVSAAQALTLIRPAAAPAAGDTASTPNAPQIGRSSAANVPSSIASLSLYGASAATDADTATSQGGYGIPDQDGDNDGH